MLLFNGSNRCEVAKLAFCSEDVKTAALPPCLSRRNLFVVKPDEVAPDGGGCVEITYCSKKSASPRFSIPRGGGIRGRDLRRFCRTLCG